MCKFLKYKDKEKAVKMCKPWQSVMFCENCQAHHVISSKSWTKVDEEKQDSKRRKPRTISKNQWDYVDKRVKKVYKRR